MLNVTSADGPWDPHAPGQTMLSTQSCSRPVTGYIFLLEASRPSNFLAVHSNQEYDDGMGAGKRSLLEVLIKQAMKDRQTGIPHGCHTPGQPMPSTQNCSRTGRDCKMLLKTSQLCNFMALHSDRNFDDQTDRLVYLMAVIHEARPVQSGEGLLHAEERQRVPCGMIHLPTLLALLLHAQKLQPRPHKLLQPDLHQQSHCQTK